jgi:hypothetical protein
MPAWVTVRVEETEKEGKIKIRGGKRLDFFSFI